MHQTIVYLYPPGGNDTLFGDFHEGGLSSERENVRAPTGFQTLLFYPVDAIIRWDEKKENNSREKKIHKTFSLVISMLFENSSKQKKSQHFSISRS